MHTTPPVCSLLRSHPIPKLSLSQRPPFLPAAAAMAKKKNRSGGGGGSGGQQQKPAEDKAVEDHTNDDKATTEDKQDKEKAKEKGKKAPLLPVVTVVLKVDMHCDGCAKRIRASVRHYTGVEGVAMDVDKATMTVVGRVDGKKLRDRVANKTKKKVDIIATNNNNKPSSEDKKQQQAHVVKVHDCYGMPDYDYYCLDKVYRPEDTHHANKQDKGQGGGGGKDIKKDDKGGSGCGEGKDNKGDKGSSAAAGDGNDNKGCGGGGKDNKKPPAVPVVGTVVLKIGSTGLHCDGCMKRVRAKLFKTKGVEQVAMDLAKNQVTVTGTMDIEALPGQLQKKMRRPVDVVQTNKDKEKDMRRPVDVVQTNKDKEKDKQQEGGRDSDKQGQDGCKDKDAATKALTAEVEMWKNAYLSSVPNIEFMLSDENPNACSVM